MKSKILTLVQAVIVVGTLITSCQSSAKKVENAEDNLSDAKEEVVDAKAELKQALNDSIQYFKVESQKTINSNERDIIELKAKIASSKAQNKAEYEKQIAELEQKNMNLKKRLFDYSPADESNWESFKSEFNRDMNVLGNALKDLTTKNTNESPAKRLNL